MKKSASLFLLFVLLTSLCTAQDWDMVWQNKPPVGTPNHPNAWMLQQASYTGLAYDPGRDVLYVVNPAICQAGLVSYPCPQVHIWNPETGAVTASIGIGGKLDTDTSVIKGGHDNGKFALYRIDLDEEGRIFACNVVAPIWGDCIPGPPPNCDQKYLNQGPFRIYRWNTPASPPELVYETPGQGDMLFAMWGTSFDVVGRRHLVNGVWRDSARIFVSGGQVGSRINDEINVFAAGGTSSPSFPYTLALRMPFIPSGTNFAGGGIAATGSTLTSPVWASDIAAQTTIVAQRQDAAAPVPQSYPALGAYNIPSALAGDGGPLRFVPMSASNLPYLIVADQHPFGGISVQNMNTSVRAITISGTTGILWPPTKTPSLGTNTFDQLGGVNNYITDVAYKIWVNPANGNRHLQVFVLMSNNGIASYRTKIPMPVPVELSQFSASRTETSVELRWETAQESNNYGFEIQRRFSRNAQWERIGFVPGNGTTSSAVEYRYLDPLTEGHFVNGSVEYRLKQTDFDGASMYSPVIEVVTPSVLESAALGQNYPNPFNPATTISYTLHQDGFVRLTVYNGAGVEMRTLVDEQQSAGSYTVPFDAPGLPSGVYSYRLNVNGAISERRMMLTK